MAVNSQYSDDAENLKLPHLICYLYFSVHNHTFNLSTNIEPNSNRYSIHSQNHFLHILWDFAVMSSVFNLMS